MADLGFFKEWTILGKNHLFRLSEVVKTRFSFRICWENRKRFLERKDDGPIGRHFFSFCHIEEVLLKITNGKNEFILKEHKISFLKMIILIVESSSGDIWMKYFLVEIDCFRCKQDRKKKRKARYYFFYSIEDFDHVFCLVFE